MGVEVAVCVTLVRVGVNVCVRVCEGVKVNVHVDVALDVGLDENMRVGLGVLGLAAAILLLALGEATTDIAVEGFEFPSL
ncbi:MAG: hypothetical protein BroJett039_07010 [Chloroflexota bacterium]|nr:MAG: hypothetical protein BroJett039_07010 [Chloroflexota bacterium]